ncbi:MAG: hypothetical protein QG650_528 [Patescibacteria group bacterium]|nr:hypothetical protein [Patescibacteria group bacterium]
MAKACTVAQKRFMIAMPLGIAAGFLCAFLASSSAPGIWWTPLMWALVTDRLLIGLVVGLAGAYLVHPVLRFPIPAWIRGTCLGVFVSLPLAFGAMINPTAEGWTVFWLTLAAGAVYGFVIDMLATKFGGEGPAMLK